MPLRFEQWREFLSMDAETVATLGAFAPLIAPYMDDIMDAVYARITANPVAAATFRNAQMMAMARERQKRHWMEHVFVGNFDAAYLAAAQAIGRAHHRSGVDLRLYMGAYATVLNRLVHIINLELDLSAADRTRYLAAINRAVFLDMGLATHVYYETVTGALAEMAQELNMSLARAGEFRDNETGRHIVRMSRMCEALALELGMDTRWAHMLRIASPLHDVGKIGIPDRILLKPGRLDADELGVMRTHAEIGGTIIPEHPAEVIRTARRISLTHHEKWDGSGYPAGLRGEEIPIEGRIAAICDVYDALVSLRPYKQPWPQAQAVAYLRENAGKHFDPQLVEAFLRILPEVDEIQAEFAEEAAGSLPVA